MPQNAALFHLFQLSLAFEVLAFFGLDLVLGRLCGVPLLFHLLGNLMGLLGGLNFVCLPAPGSAISVDGGVPSEELGWVSALVGKHQAGALVGLLELIPLEQEVLHHRFWTILDEWTSDSLWHDAGGGFSRRN